MTHWQLADIFAHWRCRVGLTPIWRRAVAVLFWFSGCLILFTRLGSLKRRSAQLKPIPHPPAVQSAVQSVRAARLDAWRTARRCAAILVAAAQTKPRRKHRPVRRWVRPSPKSAGGAARRGRCRCAAARRPTGAPVNRQPHPIRHSAAPSPLLPTRAAGWFCPRRFCHPAAHIRPHQSAR